MWKKILTVPWEKVVKFLKGLFSVIDLIKTKIMEYKGKK